MNKIKNIIVFLALCIGAGTQPVYAGCSPTDTGDSVMMKMIEKYQSFIEYKDNGEVFVVRNGNIEKENDFNTTYEAPDKFTFQWVSHPNNPELLRNRVWGENQTAYSLYSYRKKAKKISPSKALSGAHGVSYGVSFVVLPWMLFQLDLCSYIKKVNYKIINEVQYKGELTYIIQRSSNTGNYKKFWVSKKSLILRKIEFHGKKSITVIDYKNIDYE